MGIYRNRRVIEAVHWRNNDESYLELMNFLSKHSKEVNMTRKLRPNSNKLKVLIEDKFSIRKIYLLELGDYMVMDKILYKMSGKEFEKQYYLGEDIYE